MTTSYQRVLGLGPKPSKRGPKPKKRIARHVPVKRVSSRKAETVKADAEWSAAVKAKQDGFCALCLQAATDAHHVIGKKAHPCLRYDPDNGIALCRRHHETVHAEPKWFKERFARWYPHSWARLQEKARREARLS